MVTVVSEFLQHDPEGEPYFAYDGHMGVVIATPDNTTIYSHQFDYRGLDHIYTSMRDDGPSTTGAFLFRIALMDTPVDFDTVLQEMRTEGFTEITADKPDENDLRVFGMFVDANFGFKVKNKKIKRWLEDA